MKKQITCPVCEGRGFVHWFNNTAETCSTGSKTCPHCTGTGLREVPMTNADRIRAMSDEELAVTMHGMLSLDDSIHYCQNKTECDALLGKDEDIPEQNCIACLTAWLKQPAEEKGECT